MVEVGEGIGDQKVVEGVVVEERWLKGWWLKGVVEERWSKGVDWGVGQKGGWWMG